MCLRVRYIKLGEKSRIPQEYIHKQSDHVNIYWRILGSL